MMIYPPFEVRLQPGAVTGMGYYFILEPPQFNKSIMHGTVDILQLLVQWLCVLIVTGLCLLLFRDKT
jgi:hypothetical protein